MYSRNTDRYANLLMAIDVIGRRRLLTAFLCSSLILYLFLYSNTFDGIKIPMLFTNVQGSQTAFWNNTLGSLSDFLNPKNISNFQDFQNPKNISNFQFQLPLIGSSTYASPTFKPSLTKASSMSEPSSPPAVQIIRQNISSPWKERIRELKKNQTKPLLTLFTSWTDDENKYLVHNLTTLNWLSLRPFVLPIIFTNELALAKVCESAGWVVLPLRVAAADGVPVLKYMYIDAMKRFQSNFYAFTNSDILFTDTLADTLIGILQNNSTSYNSTKDNSTLQHPTLIVGRRTNVDNITMEEGSSWSEVTKVAKKRGELFLIEAEDYFITSPSYPWNDIPEVVIGHRAYDNWLVLNARKQKHRVIDATDTILAVHQTREDGNFASGKKKTTDYNHNLLVSLYKSIQYGLGVTTCAEYQTTINTGNILITSRKLSKYCDVG